MTETVDMAARGKSASNRLADAAIQGAAAAAVAYVMCVLIVGQKITATREALTLISAPVDLLLWSLTAGIGRFLLALFVWRAEPAERALAADVGAARGSLLVTLGVMWLAGGLLYLVPGVYEGVASATAGWTKYARKTVELTSLALIATFIVATAMGSVLLARRYPLLLAGVFALVCLYHAPGAWRWLFAASVKSEEPATTLDILFRLGVLGAILVGFAAAVWGGVRYLLRRADEAWVPSAVGIDVVIARYRQQFPIALLVVAATLPLLTSGPQQSYVLIIAIQIMIYVMLGWGLNVVVGLAGLLDLGYVAFYAVGAYSCALLSHTFGWTFWLCLPLAGILAALWGIMLGFPVLRLRGDYLAIVTMAFGEIIHTVANNWVSLTNGPDGISRVPKPSFFGLSFKPLDEFSFFSVFNLASDPIYSQVFMYYIIFMLALLVNAVSLRMRRLPLGRAWEALREDEIACRSLGINTVTTKLSAFAIGALFGGLAGAFFAAKQGIITPESFKFNESAMILAIVVLGGMGSQIGVALAAVALIGAEEFFRGLDEYRMFIFGLAMMAIMVWRPRGIVGSRTPSLVLKKRKAISGSLVKEGAG